MYILQFFSLDLNVILHSPFGVRLMISAHHIRRRVLCHTNRDSLSAHRAIYLGQVLKQRDMFIERHVESLPVCMPRMDKQCSNIKANNLSLDAGLYTFGHHHVHAWAFNSCNTI